MGKWYLEYIVSLDCLLIFRIGALSNKFFAPVFEGGWPEGWTHSLSWFEVVLKDCAFWFGFRSRFFIIEGLPNLLTEVEAFILLFLGPFTTFALNEGFEVLFVANSFLFGDFELLRILFYLLLAFEYSPFLYLKWRNWTAFLLLAHYLSRLKRYSPIELRNGFILRLVGKTHNFLMILFVLELNGSLETMRRGGFRIFGFWIKGDDKIIIELLKKLLSFKFARFGRCKSHILKQDLVGFDITTHLIAIFIPSVRQIKEMATKFLPLHKLMHTLVLS